MMAAATNADQQAHVAEDHGHVGNEFRLNDRDFQHLRQLVSRETGIVITDAKRLMVYSRLARRLRVLGLRDFSDYCRLLEEDGNDELNVFINCITTNLTSFFREPHHFTYLQNVVVPELMRRNAETRRIRIWSAGCSTGEEPYSIALAMAEVLPPDAGWDWRVLATDIDTDVLVRAQSGVYSLERVTAIPQPLLQRWFMRGSGANQGMVRISTELRELISFRRLNLMEEWPVRGPIDVQFCRNVVIYFDKHAQRRIFHQFAERMSDDACLFIGHSETLFKISDRFDLVGQTIYRKRD